MSQLCRLALRTVLSCSVLLHFVVCRRPLILVSCDGFRYDYLDWYPNETQFLRQLLPRGVHVERMTPAFATKTFPNHWTIATGLYHESHGIVSNYMYDSLFNATFNKSTRDERWWNASLPIWISARQQGLKSATFFWPGSEVEFQGTRQNRYFEYNSNIPYDIRVQTVLDWITKDGMHFATMYLDQPDAAGHKFGPNSEQVREALQVVDVTIRSLFDGLERRRFGDKVDVLIVSDHGMTGKQDDKVINLTNTLDSYVDKFLDSGALLGLSPRPGQKQKLVDFLKAEATSKSLHMRVFAKETLPEHYHYSKNRRIPDILVLPDQGYLVVTSHDKKPPSMGSHGFDNQYSDMQVPMFAVGPSFRKNVVLKGFRQVDIYGLMCHLLDIRPQPNNGSLALLPMMLTKSSSRLSRLDWLDKLGLLTLYKLVRKTFGS